MFTKNFTKRQELKSREVVLDGNGAFHAIFGEPNERGDKLFCKDADKIRREMVEKLKNSSSTHNDLQHKLEAEIIRWVKNKNTIERKEHEAAHKKYKKYEKNKIKAKATSAKSWDKFQKSLSKNKEIKALFSKSKITENKYNQLMSDDPFRINELIKKSDSLQKLKTEYEKTYQESAEKSKKFNWKKVLNSALINEYLHDRILKTNIVLTNGELDLIAHVFEINITLYVNNMICDVYGVKYEKKVGIQFINGPDHFARKLTDTDYESLKDKSHAKWSIDKIPFKNYQSLVDYYLWLKQAQADNIYRREKERFFDYFLQHIADMNRTDGRILDFVHLVFCGEDEIISQVLNKLFKEVKEEDFSLYLLDAIAYACKFIQTSSQEKPSTDNLIKLLNSITNLNIKKTQELQAFPAENICHALYAVNGLLDCLFNRVENEINTHREEGLNQEAYAILKVLFKNLRKNLEKKRNEYPWHYYLCYRAQNTLKAMGEVLNAVQLKKKRIAGAKSISLAAFEGVKTTAQAATGTALLAGAIAGSVASLGGAIVTIPPAVGAFGAGWYGAFISGKKGVKHIREAYKHFHHDSGIDLEEFEYTTYKKVKLEYSIEDWNKLKEQFWLFNTSCGNHT